MFRVFRKCDTSFVIKSRHSGDKIRVFRKPEKEGGLEVLGNKIYSAYSGKNTHLNIHERRHSRHLRNLCMFRVFKKKDTLKA
jgi:hypothetical protein